MVPRTDDGRVLFAIPWHGRVLVGTTDTPVDRLPDRAAPACRGDRVPPRARRAATSAGTPAPADVLSVFAGLRPLIREAEAGEQTARLSREHAVLVSASGLVTITGGKWTTYRRMGGRRRRPRRRVAGLPRRPCVTETFACTAGKPPDRGRGRRPRRLWVRRPAL